MREQKNIQNKSSKLKKAAYLSIGVLAFILLISAGRQLPYIGNRNGLDTANVSGAMRATRAFIVRDTFTTKPGDYLQLWRNSSKLTYIDSAGRIYTPELLIGTTTRDATNKLIVNGPGRLYGQLTIANGITFSNTTQGIQLLDATAYNSSINIGNSNTPTYPTTGTRQTKIGTANSVPTDKSFINVIGHSNVLTGLPSISTVLGWDNKLETGKGPFGNAILIGQSNYVTYNQNATQTTQVAIGRGNTVANKWSLVIGANITTTDSNQLVIGHSESNGTVAGYNKVFFGSGPSSGNQDKRGTDVTINGSGAGDSTDQVGGYMRIAAGKSRGAGTPPDVIFATATAIASGTTMQSLTNRWWVKGGTGYLGNSSSPTSALDVTGATGYQQIRMRTSYTPTSTADANGNTGDMAWDADYIYIKTAAGWKRATLATW